MLNSPNWDASEQSRAWPGDDGRPLGATLIQAIRTELLRLADREEALAAQEAMTVPYWAPLPSSVTGRRQAARALRAEADRLLTHRQVEEVAS